MDSQDDPQQRQPLEAEFLTLAKVLFQAGLVVRDGQGHPMDANSIEADPSRFAERRSLTWQLVLTAFCHLLDEYGYSRQTLDIDNRKLFDAIRGMRTIAIFYEWRLQPLGAAVQRNAIRDLVEMSTAGISFHDISFNLRIEAGSLVVDDTLLDLMRHLIGMLERAETPADAS